MMKKYLLNWLILLTMTIGGTLLQAEEPLPDNFQIRLGGYIVGSQNTDFKVSQNGVGAIINLQDIFKLETTVNVFRMDGYYRFTPKHSIEFSLYSIKSKGQTDQDFQWADKNITANGGLSTFFNTDIYKVNYVYSFYHNEEVELGISGGLHIMKLAAGFNGSYNVDGNLSDAAAEDVIVTAPLPVVGFRVGYNILPSLSVKYSVDYFLVTYQDINGGLVDSMLTLDWRMARNFGMGVGYNSTRMRLVKDLGGGREASVNHDVAGAMVYATLTF
jgi:hypothetical protein